jgi:hypothetical protein
MDRLYPVEVLFSFSEKKMLGGHRSKKRGEKEGEKNGVCHGPPCFDQLIDPIEERKKKILILFRRKTALTQGPFETWEKREKQTGLEHPFQGGSRRAFLEFP